MDRSQDSDGVTTYGKREQLRRLCREWIRDRHRFQVLAVLKIFAVKHIALRFEGRGDDKRVAPGEAKFRAQAKRFAEKDR